MKALSLANLGALIMPLRTPASSPLLELGSELSTTTSLLQIFTLEIVLDELRTCAMFGKGVGTGGAGGAGTLHTSGKPAFIPPPLLACGKYISAHPRRTRSPSTAVSFFDRMVVRSAKRLIPSRAMLRTVPARVWSRAWTSRK